MPLCGSIRVTLASPIDSSGSTAGAGSAAGASQHQGACENSGGESTVATLAQRTQAVEERTDRLETILANFIARTDDSIGRLERIIERMEQEAARDPGAAARERRKTRGAR